MYLMAIQPDGKSPLDSSSSCDFTIFDGNYYLARSDSDDFRSSLNKKIHTIKIVI